MEIAERLGDFTFGSMVLRLALAMACGGLLGYGRSRKERAAGLRTYMLVCLGAAAAVLISLYLYTMLHGMWQETTLVVGDKFNAARIAAQTIAGIGFIGAGIIIKVSHSQVSGLTTAAGLWTTGIIGLAIGAGYYELASSARCWCCWRRRCSMNWDGRSGIFRSLRWKSTMT